MVFFELPIKAIRSVLWLFRMLGVASAYAVWFAIRGDRIGSTEQLKFMGIVVHDELLAILMYAQRAVNRRIPRCPPDRILIVKLDRIGDMVNTTPIVDELARAFPSARLDIVGHPTCLSLFDGDERIHERIPYRSWLYHPAPFIPRLAELKTVAMLVRRRYPIVAYLRGSAPFLALGALSPLAATKYVKDEHVVDRYLKAIRPAVPDARVRATRLSVPAAALESVGRLAAGEPGALKIAIHPTAAIPPKEWPIERYVALADMLHRRYRADVHVLAGPSEDARVRSAMASSAYPHAVHTSLRLSEVAALISTCGLFVGNDSGLSHIAAAVGTPIVLVWGSANIHEARPFADPSRCTIVYRPLACRTECPELRCINAVELECVRDVQVGEVAAAAGAMLDRRLASAERRVAGR